MNYVQLASNVRYQWQKSNGPLRDSRREMPLCSPGASHASPGTSAAASGGHSRLPETAQSLLQLLSLRSGQLSLVQGQLQVQHLPLSLRGQGESGQLCREKEEDRNSHFIDFGFFVSFDAEEWSAYACLEHIIKFVIIFQIFLF